METPALIHDLDFSTVMPAAPFREFHRRTIDRPIEEVWAAFQELPANDIRLLRPLFALRGLPATLRGRRAPHPAGNRPTLDIFADEGFILLRRDDQPVDGHAIVIFGAAGRFWSPTANHPALFDTAEEFLAFDTSGYAKTVARFEAFTQPDGSTRLETETLVMATDSSSKKKFAAYWAIIRGPSGLLRRSWLAAVERRAFRGQQAP